VDADVQNSGPRDGDEVAELYLTPPQMPGAPIRALRAFARVHVAAAGTQHVHFTLGSRDLSTVNEAGDRVVAAGQYHISVGGGQPGTSAPLAESSFTIQGEQKLPE